MPGDLPYLCPTDPSFRELLRPKLLLGEGGEASQPTYLTGAAPSTLDFVSSPSPKLPSY